MSGRNLRRHSLLGDHMNRAALSTTPNQMRRIAALVLATALALLAALPSRAQPAAGGPIRLLKDINQTSLGIASPTNLTAVGDTLYFVQEIEHYGRELWRSSGTTAGARLVTDILPGLIDGDLTELTNAGGTLFFQASDAVTGLELWKSDGTPQGTVHVKAIFPGFTAT